MQLEFIVISEMWLSNTLWIITAHGGSVSGEGFRQTNSVLTVCEKASQNGTL